MKWVRGHRSVVAGQSAEPDGRQALPVGFKFGAVQLRPRLAGTPLVSGVVSPFGSPLKAFKISEAGTTDILVVADDDRQPYWLVDV